jgi:hypothetical protein
MSGSARPIKRHTASHPKSGAPAARCGRALRCAERHANGNLLRAQRDGESDDRIDSGDGEQQRPAAKAVMRSVLKRRGASTFETTSFIGCTCCSASSGIDLGDGRAQGLSHLLGRKRRTKGDVSEGGARELASEASEP